MCLCVCERNIMYYIFFGIGFSISNKFLKHSILWWAISVYRRALNSEACAIERERKRVERRGGGDGENGEVDIEQNATICVRTRWLIWWIKYCSKFRSSNTILFVMLCEMWHMDTRQGNPYYTQQTPMKQFFILPLLKLMLLTRLHIQYAVYLMHKLCVHGDGITPVPIIQMHFICTA